MVSHLCLGSFHIEIVGTRRYVLTIIEVDLVDGAAAYHILILLTF